MKKVDITIGVLGAVALLATGLGIAFYDDINDIEDYHVATSETQTFGFEDETVPSGGLSRDFDVPDNAFHAGGDLIIAWTATNPALSGSVDVTVTVTGPDGETVGDFTETFDYSSNSGTIDLGQISAWGEAPDDFAGTDDDVAENTLTWDDPLTIDISITGPQGQLPIDQDDPTYTADLDGYWHSYTIAPELPNPETA